MKQHHLASVTGPKRDWKRWFEIMGVCKDNRITFGFFDSGVKFSPLMGFLALVLFIYIFEIIMALLVFRLDTCMETLFILSSLMGNFQQLIFENSFWSINDIL